MRSESFGRDATLPAAHHLQGEAPTAWHLLFLGVSRYRPVFFFLSFYFQFPMSAVLLEAAAAGAWFFGILNFSCSEIRNAHARATSVMAL
jgi:hypothetical protein